jgi:hypothetical protein
MKYRAEETTRPHVSHANTWLLSRRISEEFVFGGGLITFDEATASQLYLRGDRHDYGDIVARGFLSSPSWGTYLLYPSLYSISSFSVLS